MKKLAVLTMIGAVVTFMAAAAASAGADNGWDNIHGEYAVIATGSCLHSTLGFQSIILSNGTPAWTPNPGSTVWSAPVMAEGTYTFASDGTGTSLVTNNIMTLPPGDPLLANPPYVGSRQVPVSSSFIYQITPDGVITVTQQTALGLLTFIGMISTDHKTLTLANTNQPQPYIALPSAAICNVGRVLIRVGE